eukprot:NODE_114_length_18474_cov_1.567510.p13 type:complete len:122 gc:universal NODE_114_length_18474_cov_1.567510:10808-11173(+)
MEMDRQLLTLVGLSLGLATGTLLVILSCAVYDNWFPLLSVLFFLLAPLCKCFDRDELGGANQIIQFFTACFICSGIFLPLVLFNNAVLTIGATAMVIVGGIIVYSSILLYNYLYSGDSMYL